jgi:hypothetical protein
MSLPSYSPDREQRFVQAVNGLPVAVRAAVYLSVADALQGRRCADAEFDRTLARALSRHVGAPL